MKFISMTLGLLLTSIKGLMTPEQVPNIDCPVASLPSAFERSTSSQVQSVLRPQHPSSTALHVSTTSLGAKKGAWMDKRGAFVIPSTYGEKKLRQLYQSGDVMATAADLLTPTSTQSSQVATTSTLTNDPLASSNGLFTSTTTQSSQTAATSTLPTDSLASSNGILTPTTTQSSQIAATSPLTSDPPPANSNSISVSTHGNTNTPNVQSQNTVSVPRLAESSSATPRPSTTTDMSNIQNPKSNLALTHSTVISSPFSAIASKPDLTPSTGTITASSKLQTSSPSSQALAFDSTILVAAKPASSKTPPLLTIGGQTVTANSLSQYNIDGQILTPGGVVTVSSTVISLASDDIDAIIGTKTEALRPHSTGGLRSDSTVTTRPVLMLGTQTLTSNSLGQYNIDGQTLTPGNAITISGTTISLASDGSDVVVGTETEALGAYSTGGLRLGSAIATRPDLILSTPTLTSNSLAQYNIDGQTLRPGNAITISGTMISLASDGSDVVIGTKTEALGAYITAGFHPGSNRTTVQDFQGRALGARDELRSSSMVVLAGFAVLLWLWL